MSASTSTMAFHLSWVDVSSESSFIFLAGCAVSTSMDVTDRRSAIPLPVAFLVRSTLRSTASIVFFFVLSAAPMFLAAAGVGSANGPTRPHSSGYEAIVSP